MRTEEEILKDFEKLGYVVVYDSDYNFIMEKPNKVQGGVYGINIDKEFKVFTKFTFFECRNHLMHITIQEHKLLNELFQCWRWI